MNSDDASALVLSEDVEFYGTLSPEPVRGESAVRDHIQQVAPFLVSVTNRKMIIEGDSGAVLTSFEAVNGVHVEGTYFLTVEDGKICEIRSVFDSRPLFSGSSAS